MPPFGFPSGSAWSKQICDALTSGSLANLLHDTLGHQHDVITSFSKEFYLSGKPTIDAFLEHRTEYEQLGKAVIAATLIRHETDSVFDIMVNPGEYNWLRYTYERLDSGFEEFGENKVSFITFNYDRVLEWFFVTALSNSYKKRPSECAELLKRIPIIHLHGRLGYLPWEASDGNKRDFNGDITKETLEACVKEIKIIYEDPSDGRDAEFTHARELLDEAERVYILGFGFHRTNVERLGLNKLTKKDKSLATGYGLTQREQGDIRNHITDGCVAINSEFRCIDFCRNIVDWFN